MQDLKLALLQLQVGAELLSQPIQRFDPLGENHQTVGSFARLPAKICGPQLRQQTLVLAEALGTGVIHQRLQCLLKHLQARHLSALVAGLAALRGQQLNALYRRLQRSGRAGKQALLQADALKLLLAASLVLATLRENHFEQGAVGRFLQGRRRLVQARCLAFPELAHDLVAYVLLEAPDDEALAAEVLRRVVVGIGNGRGVQQTHQRREAARRAVMRRGRQQDQGIGTGGQQFGQARTP